MRFPLILAAVLLLISVASSAKAISIKSGTIGRIVLPSEAQTAVWSKSSVNDTLEKSSEPASAAKTLAGIKVYFATSGSGSISISARDAVTTDAQGRFRFSQKLPDKTLLLIVPPPSLGDISAFSGIAPNRYASVTFARIRRTGPNVFPLALATQIKMTMVDHNRKPLAGRRIYFWPADAFPSRPRSPKNSPVTTIWSGISDLPEELKPLLSRITDVGGECHLFGMAQKMRYALIADLYPQRFIPLVLSQEIQTKASSWSDIPFIQIPLNGIIKGKVTSQDTGNPVVGVNVLLEVPGGEDTLGTFSSSTDHNGNYLFTGLFPGTFTVRAIAPSTHTIGDRQNAEAYSRSAIALLPDKPVAKVDLQFIRKR